MTQKQTGFTLIELLVVISIIGLLASVVMVSLNSARAKARDAKRLAEKNQMITALNLYYNDYGRWPVSASGGTQPSCLAPTAESCWTGTYTGLDATEVSKMATYMAFIPNQ